ncbi:hypothetical protein ENUP19_0274G0021 [Entamoeba nuttalli]|uniref:LIM zinc finger domain containing protein n=2 Tax=Entamoeba nuttalli TaxID=412467 RepID=K2GTF4_ENTNP|nr:LIM zinc finger domain containing protein [Entamoeba nuttalli P19]EKE38328.1 LIM zinc finger domain containing protein [Entamoeba nuttalli P19]|eukprot:XP_008859334.1 LIM zinc finger domain containing protein [Entamoeba nuttalli P19]
MPLMKIKVKYGTANKIVNIERTLPNLYEVFIKEIEQKYSGAKFQIIYKGDGTSFKIVDTKSLTDAIEHCIEHKQPFLQLEGQDEVKETPKPAAQPQKEVAKPTPSTPAKQPTTPAKTPATVAPSTPSKTEPAPASPSKPKFCTNCGAKLSGGKFCSECGAPTGESAVSHEPTTQHRPTTPPPSALDEDIIKCGKCGKPVEGGVKALGRYWHTDCFTCSVCGEKFGGNRKLMEHDGKPICSICYEETCVPRCFKCGKPLDGKYLVVDDHNYHPNCFVCTRCGKPFNGSYMLINGQPVCKKCV